MTELWHYFLNGTANGPVPVEQLRDLITGGVLGQADLVWSEGRTEWVAIKNVPEFAKVGAILQSVISPPAPASTNTALDAGSSQPFRSYTRGGIIHSSPDLLSENIGEIKPGEIITIGELINKKHSVWCKIISETQTIGYLRDGYKHAAFLTEKIKLYTLQDVKSENCYLPPATLVSLGKINYINNILWVEATEIYKAQHTVPKNGNIMYTSLPTNLRKLTDTVEQEKKGVGKIIFEVIIACIGLWLLINAYTCVFTDIPEYKERTISALSDQKGVFKDQIKNIDIMIRNSRGAVVSAEIKIDKYNGFALMCFTKKTGGGIDSIYHILSRSTKPYTIEEAKALAKEEGILDSD